MSDPHAGSWQLAKGNGLPPGVVSLTFLRAGVIISQSIFSYQELRDFGEHALRVAAEAEADHKKLLGRSNDG